MDVAHEAAAGPLPLRAAVVQRLPNHPPLPLLASGALDEPLAPPVQAAVMDAEPIAPPLPAAHASWAARWRHRLSQPSAFFVSLVVHVGLFVALASWMIVGEPESLPLAIRIGPPTDQAALDAFTPEPFEIAAEQPPGPAFASAPLAASSPSPAFGEVTAPDASALDRIASEAASRARDSELQNAIAGSFDAHGGARGQGGLFDESFAGMIEYALDHGLDIAIVFDSTGSMGNDIRAVKERIDVIGRSLIKKVPTVRISLCTYRDSGDEYLVKGVPLTKNLRTLTAFLDEVQAGGGGDHPEAVEAGLAWATSHNKFRSRARKVVLVFGDAPPHAEQLGKCADLADRFHRYQKGVVSTITVRGAEPLAEFRRIAQMGGGSAFAMADSRLLMEELVVQVFGEQHRAEAVEFFDLEAGR